MHIYISSLLILSSLILAACNDPSSTPKYRTEGRVTTLAGSGTSASVDGTGATAQFKYLQGISIDSAGNLYAVDSSKIRKITPAGVATTITAVDNSQTAVAFGQINGITIGSAGQNLYVSELGIPKDKIYKFALSTSTTPTKGVLSSTITMNQSAGFQAIAVSSGDKLYIANSGTHKIEVSQAGGAPTELAGTAGEFNNPAGITIDDSEGNLYVSDTLNHRIRKITLSTISATPATVSTIAGSGTAGGADGTGTAAQFHNPAGITIDSGGNLYVADNGNHSIRKISPSGVVTTLAGNGTAGYADGTGTAAKFNKPNGIAIDSAGNLYVADEGNDRIRKVTPVSVKVN